jgi:MFS family permease
VTPEARLLFAGRAVRTFAFGALSLVLAFHLAGQGFSAQAIGFVFTASLVEDAAFTLLVSARAAAWGRRRVLLASSLFMIGGGAGLALATRPSLVVVAAVLGTVSLNGQDAGPFSPIEQALLPGAVPADRRTRAFAWYNVFGFLPSAVGALAAGGWLALAHGWGLPPSAAYRAVLWAFAAAGVIAALVYLRLPRSLDAAPPPAPRAARFGLHRSRAAIVQLSALGALDSFAGGFIVQSLLVYWFHLRFGVEAAALGPLFFGTNLLSAVSFLVAARVAERVGLLETMVFSHLPSNLLLVLVPFAGSFPAAALLLLLRHLLSQMDVPTRQAYTMALVDPDERPAAAGLTASARSLAQTVAPALAGFALGHAATGLPFFLAGALKSAYDLALYWRFRKVPLR